MSILSRMLGSTLAPERPTTEAPTAPGEPAHTGNGRTNGTAPPDPSGGGSGRGGGAGRQAGGFRRPKAAAKVFHHVGRPLLGLVSALVIIAGSVVLIDLGNGDFSSSYSLSAAFSTATAGLHPGSQVEERGVQIGSVRSIELVHGRAVVTMAISSQFKLPTDSSATIEPQNLFGADQVTIAAPPGRAAGLLHDGSSITHTAELTELGQLFATADPLLRQIDTADLARTIGELAAAYGGQGQRIAASLTSGTKLADLFSRTTTAQLAALDAFTRFTLAIENEGPTLDALAYDGNRTLPLFNRAEGAYVRVLDEFGTFGDRLSVLLADYRPQINTILDAGGNVTRVLLAERPQLAQMVQGLAMYAYRFAHGASPATLPDGTKMGYFKTFLLWSDVQHLICSLIAPAAGGLSYLQPLQHVLLGGGSPLNCSAELAKYAAAQAGPAPASQPATAPSHGSHQGGQTIIRLPNGGSVPAGVGGAVRRLAKGLYGALSVPQPTPGLSSIGSYVDSLLP